MLDPVDETNALRDRVRSGFITLGDAMRSQGYRNPRAALAENAETLKAAREAGLVLDVDGSLTGMSGASTVEAKDKTKKKNGTPNRIVELV